jgi:hypothetical protein
MPKARERDKLERLCRYITRAAVSEQRLSLTPNDNVRYQLKTPYRDGTTPAERHAIMTWVPRLKRVFNIDIETCRACGGTVKVIACIRDPTIIDKILTHLQEKVVSGPNDLLPQCRASAAGLFD